MEQGVFESVRYAAVCQDCGAELECWGVHALVDGRLRWDVESTCSTCGVAVMVCGGALPAERREQMLSEHGPAWLRVSTPPKKGVVIMRVLRTELGIDLADARAALRRVLEGDYSGTLPEVERVARALRRSGIAAAATRTRSAFGQGLPDGV
ncbi:hypothetical protein [Streptomyces sp. UH6]|uniref:hypothetical protein n=1 Tax=Streptomyces sp. UH6 TaxID=2748379 RepID=UPI0015D4AE63|nr:hypothetical protein [Streptomyces sp. UH6]NYV76048.1 hypothetical protein [Streptomyces sp. UH6]